MKGLKGFLHDCRAATAVEFAFLFPVMMAIIAGVFGYSRVLFAEHMVRDIVDEAARAGVIKNMSDGAVESSIDADMDDVPGAGSHVISVSSNASALTVSVTVSMNLAFGDLLPTDLISFTIRNEYPK